MTELTKEQVEILEKPFQGVIPKISSALWRAYRTLWTMENGVPVRASKHTVSTLQIEHDKKGEVTGSQLVDERTAGFSLEFAQKVGKLTIGQTNSWRVLSFDGPEHMHLQKHKTSYKFFVNEGESPEGADDNANLIEFLDSHECSQDPILVMQEAIVIPEIETEEQLVEIFGTYKAEE